LKIVIVGAGQVGFHVARRLALEKKDVVVIDRDSEATQRLTNSLDVQAITGSGSSPVILEEAGIKDADILLAVTDSDEINLAACLMTDILSPTTKKLARIRDADFDPYHDTFLESAPHIDTVINPDIEVVKTIMQLMSVPGAVEVGEFEEGRIRFVAVYLDPGSPLSGALLSELPQICGDKRPLITAIVRDEVLIIPRGDDRLLAGDLVYFISEQEKLFEALKEFGKQAEEIKRVMIVGAGRIGFRLAAALEKKSIYGKIIESNADRCAELAERLDKTVVLSGDGSDQALLAEENIQQMDVLITLTNDEEINILSSLLAQRMGVKKSITRIDKFSYLPLVKAIGIELVVSPRLSAINSILQHIRRGKVLSAMSIKGEQAEVIEAVALETSDIVGRPLKAIKFPAGAMLAGIIRQDAITIPSGESTVNPGDRIIIFARRDSIPKIEKMLSVKLEFF
jgi:trk system potassium uptake protein TrkA